MTLLFYAAAVMTGACYHTQLSPMRCGSLEL
jgi:hypothetical protein